MKRLQFFDGSIRQRTVLIAVVTFCFILLSSVAVHYFERQAADSNIQSVWDGIWWAVVTVATVGYGDRFPISIGGKIVAFALMFFGVGMMSILTATIASTFVERKIMEERGLETVKFKDHLVICGWNHHTEELLAGLTAQGANHDAPIVLINELSVDQIEALRLKYTKCNLKFLRGDYAREDVLLRANIAGARSAVIMADVSGGHSLERIDERTALAALTIKCLAPNVRMVAELLDGENRQHLKRANVEEIIVREEHIGSLLATAVHSPGLPRVISGMLALGENNRFWRVEIPKSFIGSSFQELSAYYREKRQAILIGFLKDKRAMKLEDLLSDNTSEIDNFIRQKLREAKKEFYIEKDEARIVVNPAGDYTITVDDCAVVLSKTMPK